MKSIVHKLWLATTMLVIIILGIVWIVQTVYLDRFYINGRINIIVEESVKIGQNLDGLDINNVENSVAIDHIVYFSNQYNSRIDILNKEQEQLLSIGSFGGRGMGYGMGSVHIDIDTVMRGETVVLQTTHPRFGTPIVIIGVPILNNGIIAGAMIINTPLASVKEAIKALQDQLPFILLLSLLIALLLTFFMSLRIVKPIIGINEAAKKISQGDYKVKIDIKSKDEAGILANTINEMAQQLSKIETLRKDFISNVSHEFKTPLGLIKGYTELISDNLQGEELERNKLSLDIILDETSKLDKMVKNMLLISQMESGFEKLEVTEFNINETIEEVINRLLIIASKQNVQLEFKSKCKYAITKADKTKIGQVIMNLINNAIQHSSQNEIIEVYAENIDSKVKVSIKDYGEGISKEDLPYIWDRFFKADKSRKREDNRTGLGMVIVKNILNLHNADYGIESKLGEGTIVWFIL